ncbi:MAG: efflux RND transporter periplasmic adaptor subunit, partial [Flavobacteriales bacterium]|nr:efflux RND transporter periplasmic adaptor subunit [Flavobacteriales bacterium]
SKIYVDYNSVVTQGQVLAEIDRSLMAADYNSSKASLSSAKSEFEYQEKNYNRIKGLWEKKLISDTEYESAKYSYEKAVSSYNKSKSDIVRAQSNLGYTTITSPIDGVVLSRAVEEGQTVASSFNTPTLFTIANDLRKMRVIVDVDESDIGQVKEGQRAVFTVDAFPDDTFEGTVSQVRLQATTTSSVVTYEVVIDAPNPDLILMPGLTAQCTIYTMEKNDVLTIPTKAFKYMPEAPKNAPQDTKSIVEGQKKAPKELAADQKMVWVLRGTSAHPVKVKIGLADNTSTEIISGLSVGDKVVLSASSDAKVEMPVQGSAESSPFMPTPPGGNKKK